VILQIPSILQTFRFALLLFLVVGLTACSVFGPVGEAISYGFENTVSYFNLYYNARRAFRDAESEILVAAKAARGKTPLGSSQVALPANAQKNLDLVIDKCSNILSYHSKSGYVQNALMLIGKSHFYRSEYSKAERKFSELISQFPKSDLVLEAQLWYARCLQKLGRSEEAFASVALLQESAANKGENDILSDCFSLRAMMYESQNAIDRADEFYEKAGRAADDDELKANAYLKAGELYCSDKEFEKAIKALQQVWDNSDDAYLLVQSRVLAASAFRQLRQFEKAIAATDKILADFRLKDYFGVALLERANTLMMSGRKEEAVDQFRALDTLYARTEVAAKSDYELGFYYETSVGDFGTAKDYYSRGATIQGVPISLQSSKKATALNGYAILKRKLFLIDSMYLAQSQAAPTKIFPDSNGIAKADTIRKIDSLAASTPRKVVIAKDSLDRATSTYALGLGDIFYTDLSNPDSAIFWYTTALRLQYSGPTAPRLLYTLAELASSFPGKTPKSSEVYKQDLRTSFPKSVFARQGQFPTESSQDSVRVVDPGEPEYAAAERLIDAEKFADAVKQLERITSSYPSSLVSAKSNYAIGWIYENRLARPDSAVVHYKRLLAMYPGSVFAKAVSVRMLDSTIALVQPLDTTQKVLVQPVGKRDSVQVLPQDDEIKRPNVRQPSAPSRRDQVQKQSVPTKEKD
jgi:tetratricopeptide (TPR) repeat protein